MCVREANPSSTKEGVKMFRRIALGMLLVVIILFILGCGGSAKATIRPTWIPTQIAGDMVSVPVSRVQSDKMTHFRLDTPAGEVAFMAYDLAGKTYVRSNICPPCRSIGFSLKGDVLVCNTCGTTFKASTGDGIAGACVGFPKASVPYKITAGNIVMTEADLIAAYQNTIQPGKP